VCPSSSCIDETITTSVKKFLESFSSEDEDVVDLRLLFVEIHCSRMQFELS
jgi:hypothetical protein